MSEILEREQKEEGEKERGGGGGSGGRISRGGLAFELNAASAPGKSSSSIIRAKKVPSRPCPMPTRHQMPGPKTMW